MVYIPREIIHTILKARRQMMFKDRIKHLDSILHIPMELLEIQGLGDVEIWKARTRIGFYEISRIAIYSDPINDLPFNTQYHLSTFYMYKWYNPLTRINVGYHSVALSWEVDGTAIEERTTMNRVARPPTDEEGVSEGIDEEVITVYFE